MKSTLVSFELCPFVQRSVITLLEKRVKVDVVYLTLDELTHPPEWFKAISPSHRVPVLRVGEISLFESAVINEYLDEIHPPSLHPQDPLQRALNRAWIVFAEEVLFSHYRCFTAPDKPAYDENYQQLNDKLAKLEGVLGEGPFFNGSRFSLIDTAYTPAFLRMELLERRHGTDPFNDKPKLRRWADACLQRQSIWDSVPQGFEQKLYAYIRDKNGYGRTLYA